MPVLEELSGYLIANTTRFKVGGSTGSKTPIYRGRFPANAPNDAVALFESGGPGPQYIQTGTLSFERPSVQVISRSTSYVTARNNAQTIYNSLAAVTNTSISKGSSTGTTAYLTITPIQSPTDMGRDADERNMITCNYLAEKVVS